MSVQQDRLTFFGVLAAVAIVVLGYLQLGRLYPVAGREDVSAKQTQDTESERERESAPLEGESRP